MSIEARIDRYIYMKGIAKGKDCTGENWDTGRQVYIRKGEATDVNAGRACKGYW